MLGLATDECVCFRYENFDVPYGPAKLYLCNGRCCWQDDTFVSGWHGSYRIVNGFILVKFNCRCEADGPGRNLKTTVLFRSALQPETFGGLDYAERRVRMTTLWRKVYEWNTWCWEDDADWEWLPTMALTELSGVLGLATDECVCFRYGSFDVR